MCDAIVFGANTLRAYGTSLTIKNPELLKQRQQKDKPPQPLHIVCSSQGNLNPDWRFFSQPLPRALLTTNTGKENWLKQINSQPETEFFDRYFFSTNPANWQDIFTKLQQLKYQKIAILGGAKLISSLLNVGLIDDIWLTICPLIMGKKSATSIVDYNLLEEIETPIELKLIEVKQINQEIFAHYLICRI